MSSTTAYQDFLGNPVYEGYRVNYAGMSHPFEIVGFRPEGVAIIRSLDPGHGHGYTSTVPLRNLVRIEPTAADHYAAEAAEHRRSAPECPGQLCPECWVCPLCAGDGHSESCSRQGEETVRIPLAQCCGYHNANCEPPAELCCMACTEANHPEHPRGVTCAWKVCWPKEGTTSA
jgi:hypothetical protein